MQNVRPFVLTLFTNDPDLAAAGDAAGIDRIGLDLEAIGKAQRQAGLNAWISDHVPEQLESIGHRLGRAKLFIRTNPVHPGLGREIDSYIARGARVLMLPMFHTAAEARTFVDLIAGRAEVSLLVETPAAAARLHEIVAIPGVDEIHVGLNDMYLGMKLASHFEVLASDLLDSVANTVLDAGIAFGFGGIGRRHDDRLPISSDLVYAQYARLGADRALVSRVFTSPDFRQLDLADEVRQFRQRMEYWRCADRDELDRSREQLRREVRKLVLRKAAKAPAPQRSVAVG